MTTINEINNLPKFTSGNVLNAHELNHVYSALEQIAKKANIHFIRKCVWIEGTMLTADSLNDLLDDVELMFKNLNLTKPKWKFGRFKNGTILKADHLNEIVDKVKICAGKIDLV